MNTKEDQGTPLNQALEEGHGECAVTLIKAGVNETNARKRI